MRRLDHSMQTVICGRDPATEEDLRAVSPCLLVDGDTPPTFLWATSEDRGVSVRNSLRTVSYTHLDVYKRQPFRWWPTAGPMHVRDWILW